MTSSTVRPASSAADGSSMKARYSLVIALILLGLYCISFVYLISDEFKWFDQFARLEGWLPEQFDKEWITFIYTTIGGLISALVVGQLAITKPNTDPAEAMVARMGSAGSANPAEKRVKTGLKFAVNAYLIVWLIVGCMSVLFIMFGKDVSETIINSGKIWVGTALGAAGVFFGIDPA